MRILILQLCVIVLLGCMLVLIGLLIQMLRDEVRERRDRKSRHLADLANATFNLVIDDDGKIIPLATNYSGLRAMSDDDLIRAADYTARHTTKNL